MGLCTTFQWETLWWSNSCNYLHFFPNIAIQAIDNLGIIVTNSKLRVRVCTLQCTSEDGLLFVALQYFTRARE